MSRDFAKLWIGQAISQTGSRISREGIPLTAALVLGATPLQMGLLSGAGAVAVLLFGLFAGAWSDRLRRRPVMIFADIARAALLALIPLAAKAGSLTMTHLYVVGAFAGILSIWFDSSYQAYVPSLVEASRLATANSRLAMSESLAEVIGPGLTGILVQLLTAPFAILLDAVSFLISAASLSLIRTPEPEPEKSAAGDIIAEIVEGLRTAWAIPLLRVLLFRTAIVSFFSGFPAAMYMVFAVRELKLTPALLGLVISVGGFSSLFGAAINDWLIRRWGVRRTFVGSALLTALTAVFPPLARGPIPLCAALLALGQVFDMSWMIYGVNELTLRQQATPESVLGRVNSAMLLLFRGLMPVGSMAAGLLAEAVGIRAALFTGAAGIALSALPIIGSRKLLPGESRSG